MTPYPITPMIEMDKTELHIGKRVLTEMTTGQGDAVEFYEFRVRDHLEDGWFRMFPGLSVKNVENGEVLISGWLDGPSAVHAVLERIRNLNLILLSAERIKRPGG